MEEAIKLYLLRRYRRKRFREIYKNLSHFDKSKIDILLWRKNWDRNWRKVYLKAEDKHYINCNKALMLFHCSPILTWNEWTAHAKFLTYEQYEKLFK